MLGCGNGEKSYVESAAVVEDDVEVAEELVVI